MFCSLMGSYVAFSSSLTFLLPTLTSVRTGHLYRIALFDLLTAVPCLVTFRQLHLTIVPSKPVTTIDPSF